MDLCIWHLGDELFYEFLSSWIKAVLFTHPPLVSSFSFAWVACIVLDPWVPSSGGLTGSWQPSPALPAEGPWGSEAGAGAGRLPPGFGHREMSLQF